MSDEQPRIVILSEGRCEDFENNEVGFSVSGFDFPLDLMWMTEEEFDVWFDENFAFPFPHVKELVLQRIREMQQDHLLAVERQERARELRELREELSATTTSMQVTTDTQAAVTGDSDSQQSLDSTGSA